MLVLFVVCFLNQFYPTFSMNISLSIEIGAARTYSYVFHALMVIPSRVIVSSTFGSSTDVAFGGIDEATFTLDDTDDDTGTDDDDEDDDDVDFDE